MLTVIKPQPDLHPQAGAYAARTKKKATWGNPSGFFSIRSNGPRGRQDQNVCLTPTPKRDLTPSTLITAASLSLRKPPYTLVRLDKE